MERIKFWIVFMAHGPPDLMSSTRLSSYYFLKVLVIELYGRDWDCTAVSLSSINRLRGCLYFIKEWTARKRRVDEFFEIKISLSPRMIPPFLLLQRVVLGWYPRLRFSTILMTYLVLLPGKLSSIFLISLWKCFRFFVGIGGQVECGEATEEAAMLTISHFEYTSSVPQNNFLCFVFYLCSFWLTYCCFERIHFWKIPTSSL